MDRSLHVPVNYRDDRQHAIIAFDRRKEQRHRVLKEALIVLNNGLSTMGVVRDISEGGARLRVPWTYGLPEVFQLAIKGESQIREVRKVWSTRQEMGVKFVRTGK